MIDQDKREFKEGMDGLCEYYGKKNLSKVSLQIYFSGLSKYSLEIVTHAINAHLQDTKCGQFMPKIGDLVRIIEGVEATSDQVIAAARNKKTPFGVFCRIQIGHYDLDYNKDMFYLKQRAEECIQKMGDWKERALNGEYTDHEISVMLKYNIDPMQPFQNGLLPPLNYDQLKLKIDSVLASDSHAKFLEKPVEPSKQGFSKEIVEFVKQNMK